MLRANTVPFCLCCFPRWFTFCSMLSVQLTTSRDYTSFPGRRREGTINTSYRGTCSRGDLRRPRTTHRRNAAKWPRSLFFHFLWLPIFISQKERGKKSRRMNEDAGAMTCFRPGNKDRGIGEVIYAKDRINKNNS